MLYFIVPIVLLPLGLPPWDTIKGIKGSEVADFLYLATLLNPVLLLAPGSYCSAKTPLRGIPSFAK